MIRLKPISEAFSTAVQERGKELNKGEERMSDTIKEMKVIADEMVAIMENERLVNQYNEVLADGKKLAAYIVKTDEEMENLKGENKRLLIQRDTVENTLLRSREVNKELRMSYCRNDAVYFNNEQLKAENAELRNSVENMQDQRTELQRENELLREKCRYATPEQAAFIRKEALADVREKLVQMVCKDAVAETRAVATLDEVLNELGA